MVQSMGARVTGLIGPERIDRGTLKDLATEFGLDTARSGEDLSGAVEHVESSPQVTISMSEQRPDPADFPDVSPGSIWWFCDGDPRRDAPDAGLEPAIFERRPRVAITLRALAERPEDDRVLAFADAPRRPWDSRRVLQTRLESFLPQLVSDASDRDLLVRIGPHSTPSLGVSALGSRWPVHFEQLTDLKFYVHLLFMRVRPLLRFEGTYIVFLHNPAPDILDEILAILGRLGPLVPYTEVAEAILRGQSPKRGFALTFDDGYKENTALLDILDKHECKAMFFLNTAVIDSQKPLWFMNPDKDYPGVKPRLKRLDYQSFLATIEEKGLTERCALRGRFGLSSGEVKQLLARGHAVGLHTHNHPFLTQLNSGEIETEIVTCAEVLRKITGDTPCTMDFGYPDGNHDARVADRLDTLGIRSAVTVEPGTVSERVRPTMIPRFGLNDTDYPGVAVFRLSSPYRFLKRLQAAFTRGD
jgi:peptidoglycan/xylan/chitin deacetylase (PgdA/CDA1 family)